MTQRHVLLSDLVDEFEASQRSNAYGKHTIRNRMLTARKFLAHVGNIQVRNVTPTHIDGYFSHRQAAGLTAGSLNVELQSLRSLFRYAIARRYLAATADPLAHRRQWKTVKGDLRQRVPAQDFPYLLDCAKDPRDRIVVALGLYLFLRASEMRVLKVGDVDLASAEVAVQVIKSSRFDRMPVSTELDTELRRWLTAYGAEMGRPLTPDDHLVPARNRARFVSGLSKQENWAHAKAVATLNPAKPYKEVEQAVQRTLAAYGMPVRDEMGKSLREGVHTLRRSGARALFDALIERGFDGSMRTVQSMLHHSSVTVTEHYLGLRLDEKRRDDIVRGKAMFPVDRSNVVQMEARRESNEGVRHSV